MVTGFGVTSSFAQDATSGDLAALQVRISEQQEKIRKLKQAVDEEQKLLDGVPRTGSAAQAAAAPLATTDDGYGARRSVNYERSPSSQAGPSTGIRWPAESAGEPSAAGFKLRFA